MQVKIDSIRETLVMIIANRSDLNDDEARTLAEDYLEGELQGKKSHGLAAFVSVIPTLACGVDSIEILKETEAALYVDAHGRYGALAGREVAKQLIKKAHKQGVAMGSICEMRSWLRPASIAQIIAESGMIGVVTNTGGVPMVAPPNGYEPVVGTNPIGIGIPSEDGPMVTDMATSTRAWGAVRLALASGEPLPDKAYFDDHGNITRDAEQAHSALPFGAHKGFALAWLIELLGGALVDMPMGKGDGLEDYRTRKRGASIIVIDPGFTVGQDAFASSAAGFAQEVRDTAPLPGKKSVSLPGDRAAQTKAKNLESGEIDVDDAVWQAIAKEDKS